MLSFVVGLAALCIHAEGLTVKKDAAVEAKSEEALAVESQEAKFKQADAKDMAYHKTQQTAEAKSMQAAMMSNLAEYVTEEGKAKMEKLLKEKSHTSLSEGVDEMEWFSDVARDGVMKFAEGYKFHVLDPKSPMGKLPKGLPEFPTDPKERDDFLKTLPVDGGTYSVMLKLKNNPSSYVEVAQDKFKGALSSLAEDSQGSSKDLDFFNVKNKEAVVEVAKNLEETKKSSIEVIKASPKAFKKALRNWEKIVPEAASLLLQTSSDESEQEAKTLAERAGSLHQSLFSAVEAVTNKDQLMSVAQNRITSLLMRQSEETLKDFDALEGCTDAAKDYSGSETRCLCVADNICHKVGHASSGNLCSIVSSSTCMVPKDEQEAKVMSTV